MSNPLLQTDSYKLSHREQYPAGTEQIYSNFTARSGQHSGIPDSKGVWFVGLQYFIKEYLINEWNNKFFTKPKNEVVMKYKNFIENFLHSNVSVEHIEQLHDLGYLPLTIKALPEGSFVPYKVPLLTVTNTKPEFFWLVNYIETVLSNDLWLPITSATTYRAFYKNSLKYSELTCDNNFHIPYQNHDFSMRGMQNRSAAALSGFAALATGSFGTDTLPAVELAIDYYNASFDDGIIGTSIPASEHSVMTGNGAELEFETYKRLITEVHPNRFLALVSDSYDFWKVVSEFLPALKDEIMNRDGKLVIRPDSGDPVDIICGYDYIELPGDNLDQAKADALTWLVDRVDHETQHGTHGEDEPQNIFKWNGKYYSVQAELSWNRYDKQYYYLDGEHKVIKFEEIKIEPYQRGLIECLWETFGGTVNSKGYKVLDDHIGAIYGDSITLGRQERILNLLEKKGFAASNIVFGIGSYTYSYQTRDTHGLAFKSTYAKINGVGKSIYKDPKTDTGTKKSAKGLLMVTQTGKEFALVDEVTPNEEARGVLEIVFQDGKLLKDVSLEDIRSTVKQFS